MTMREGDAADALTLLFPRPQRMRLLGGQWRLPLLVTCDAAADMRVGPALAWLQQAVQARGHQWQGAEASQAHIRLRLEGPASGPERAPSASDSPLPIQGNALTRGYRLAIAEEGLSIVATSAAGLQHAVCTLVQLIALAAGDPGQLLLPRLELEDWPDFPVRGVMLDVSRDKVPTLQTLQALIDRFARWKLNQVQLYMEHTFAYADHARVWQDASPLSAEEVRALDAYAAARHIELVPNQNSFGHMHRWLRHDAYRALAECPLGFEHPWNWTGEPYGLCATDPASLSFLERLYDELLPNFQSRLFNVGLDETIDLGCGRSKAACETRGTEQVYLEFLKEVHARVAERGHTMQFWGDVIVNRPSLVAALPRDAIALEWGYEADHPFAEHLALFQKAGLDFYVCPGTSSWNSIAGRTENAIANLARAAREGHAAGASGLLITDWGDHGHLQPLSVSYLGLLLGAGFSWNVADAERASELDVPRLLDTHAFFDTASVLGKVAYDLGNTYREAGSLRPNASVLFWSLIKPERLFSPPGVTRETLESTLAYLERVSDPLPRARPRSAEGPIVIEELGWARDLLGFACRLGMLRASNERDSIAELPFAPRATLARELTLLIERQRHVWLARNRPGGLADSRARLETTLRALRS